MSFQANAFQADAFQVQATPPTQATTVNRPPRMRGSGGGGRSR